jgi:hypothetical protein
MALPKITREGYIAELSPRYRALVKSGDYTVLECDCGEPICQGWQLACNVLVTPLIQVPKPKKKRTIKSPAVLLAAHVNWCKYFAIKIPSLNQIEKSGLRANVATKGILKQFQDTYKLYLESIDRDFRISKEELGLPAPKYRAEHKGKADPNV